ncbi:MAG: hypothetical protein WC460_05870 [Patescibacteria group bacterium]
MNQNLSKENFFKKNYLILIISLLIASAIMIFELNFEFSTGVSQYDPTTGLTHFSCLDCATSYRGYPLEFGNNAWGNTHINVFIFIIDFLIFAVPIFFLLLAISKITKRLSINKK